MAVYILSVHDQNVSAKDATSMLFLFIQSMYFRPDEIKDDLFPKIVVFVLSNPGNIEADEVF